MEKPSRPSVKAPAVAQKQAKKERLARALRANLQRRKAASGPKNP